MLRQGLCTWKVSEATGPASLAIGDGMKVRYSTLICCAALPMLAASPVFAQTDTRGAQEGEVRNAVESYARALASGDSLAALELLHADVTINEGGHAETLEQYRSGHLRSDIAFAAAVPRTTISDSVLISGDVALYTSEYRARGRFRGRDIDSHGAETMVLLRTAEGWRIRHIHWSSR